MKKTISFALALVMCLSLMAPSFAATPIANPEDAENITVTAEIGNLSMDDLKVEKSWTREDYDMMEGAYTTEMTSYYAVRPDTKFTVSHTGAPDGEKTYVIYANTYLASDHGTYNDTTSPYSYYLTKSGRFIENLLDPNAEDGGLVDLAVGESVTFTLPFSLYDDEGGDVIILLRVLVYESDYDDSPNSWTYGYYKVDTAAYDAAAAKGPSQSEPPVVPAKPETAMPTNDKLTVDGKLADPTVYKIDGSNYFKIRDVAALLDGTGKQFSVGYDGTLKSVTATTGQGYTKLDTDLVGAPTGGNKTAAPSNDTIYVNGQKIDATVYKIDGGNYFKLRDLGKALNFSVDWNKEAGMIIDTSKPYTE